MKFFKLVNNVLDSVLFNAKWRCNVCGTEIFDGDYFCDKCKNELPFNDSIICNHCGRKLIVPSEYCTTCKGTLVFVDKCRSVFSYEKPIDELIKKSKYDGKKYLLDIFAEYLAKEYLKNAFLLLLK